MAYEVVPQVVCDAQREYAIAQALLGGPAGAAQVMQVGWHGTSVHPLRGCFAVVRAGGEFEDLVGQIVRVTYRRRTLFAVVVAARTIPVDLSLARSVFWQLAPLYAEKRTAKVAVRS